MARLRLSRVAWIRKGLVLGAIVLAAALLAALAVATQYQINTDDRAVGT